MTTLDRRGGSVEPEIQDPAATDGPRLTHAPLSTPLGRPTHASAEPESATPAAGPPEPVEGLNGRGRRRKAPEESAPAMEAMQTVLLPRISLDAPEPAAAVASVPKQPARPKQETANGNAETVMLSRISVDGPETTVHRAAILERPGEDVPDGAQTVMLSRIVLPFRRTPAPARDHYAWENEQDPYGDEQLWRPDLFTATVKATGTVLPKPPSQRTEKYLYNERRMWVLMIGMVMSAPFLLYTQLGFLANSMRLWVLFPVVMMTPIVIVIRLLLELGTHGFDFDQHNKLIGRWSPATHPTVDIMLPVCGESLEVLRNTWKHVTALQDGYPGMATAYVLDDASRSEVATMAAEFGFRYGSRPNRGWFKKAGNLNFGLENSSGEYILILDADFVPSTEMLMETLPYFDADPKLGILQTPQFFKNAGEQSFIERGAATSQELFYRAVQVARDQRDAVVCCGTNAVYRRAALAENDGITLISHSEDAHTGIDLRRLGWHVRYLPVNLASGLCPADVDSFFSQQYRWCVGTISIVADRGFWTTKMPLSTRLYDIVGFLYYVETAMFTILSPLIAVILCLVTPHEVILRNYVLVLPSAIYTFVMTPLWHRVRCGVDMWPVTVIVSWSNIFAFWDAVRGRQMSWRPSGGKKKSNRRLWIGLWTWSLGMAVLGVALSGWRMLDMNTAAFTPIFIPAVFYLLTILRILGSKWTTPIDA